MVSQYELLYKRAFDDAFFLDGLSRLPPVRLKSEDSIDNDKTPMATKFGDNISTSESAATVKPSQTKDKQDVVNQSFKVESQTPSEADMDLRVSTSSSATKTPLLTISPPLTKPTPVSGDILLPLLIFSVVKANPSQLVSHLLYTQRFRNRSVGGEESYCLVNLMAVVEFLENVDLGALGLKDSESKVMR